MLEYKPLTQADLPGMAEIFRKFLNDGPEVEDYLRQGMEMPGYVGIKCTDGQVLAAVLTARPGVEFTYPKPELEEMILERWKGKRFYTGEMVTVLPAYRGQGVARTMTLQWAQAMRENGGEYLMLELWDKKDGDVPASGMIKYIGTLEESWVIPDFYKDLHKYGMTCPDCSPGPCTCGATVAVIRL